ncbi:MAG: hypothetical protein ISQ32_01115 [Rickettsiales bacterium]|nr:hypothetical protein [Rickettsiales bacterium]
MSRDNSINKNDADLESNFKEMEAAICRIIGDESNSKTLVSRTSYDYRAAQVQNIRTTIKAKSSNYELTKNLQTTQNQKHLKLKQPQQALSDSSTDFKEARDAHEVESRKAMLEPSNGDLLQENSKDQEIKEVKAQESGNSTNESQVQDEPSDQSDFSSANIVASNSKSKKKKKASKRKNTSEKFEKFLTEVLNANNLREPIDEKLVKFDSDKKFAIADRVFQEFFASGKYPELKDIIFQQAKKLNNLLGPDPSLIENESFEIIKYNDIQTESNKFVLSFLFEAIYQKKISLNQFGVFYKKSHSSFSFSINNDRDISIFIIQNIDFKKLGNDFQWLTQINYDIFFQQLVLEKALNLNNFDYWYDVHKNYKVEDSVFLENVILGLKVSDHVAVSDLDDWFDLIEQIISIKETKLKILFLDIFYGSYSLSHNLIESLDKITMPIVAETLSTSPSFSEIKYILKKPQYTNIFNNIFFLFIKDSKTSFRFLPEVCESLKDLTYSVNNAFKTLSDFLDIRDENFDHIDLFKVFSEINPTFHNVIFENVFETVDNDFNTSIITSKKLYKLSSDLRRLEEIYGDDEKVILNNIFVKITYYGFLRKVIKLNNLENWIDEYAKHHPSFYGLANFVDTLLDALAADPYSYKISDLVNLQNILFVKLHNMRTVRSMPDDFKSFDNIQDEDVSYDEYSKVLLLCSLKNDDHMDFCNRFVFKALKESSVTFPNNAAFLKAQNIVYFNYDLQLSDLLKTLADVIKNRVHPDLQSARADIAPKVEYIKNYIFCNKEMNVLDIIKNLRHIPSLSFINMMESNIDAFYEKHNSIKDVSDLIHKVRFLTSAYDYLKMHNDKHHVSVIYIVFDKAIKSNIIDIKQGFCSEMLKCLHNDSNEILKNFFCYLSEGQALNVHLLEDYLNYFIENIPIGFLRATHGMFENAGSFDRFPENYILEFFETNFRAVENLNSRVIEETEIKNFAELRQYLTKAFLSDEQYSKFKLFDQANQDLIIEQLWQNKSLNRENFAEHFDKLFVSRAKQEVEITKTFHLL